MTLRISNDPQNEGFLTVFFGSVPRWISGSHQALEIQKLILRAGFTVESITPSMVSPLGFHTPKEVLGGDGCNHQQGYYATTVGLEYSLI